MHTTRPSSTSDDDVVAIGLVADPFITSGPWVVHPYWDTLPPGNGVPLHDTPCKPVPVRKVCDRSANSPTPIAFAANYLESRRLGRIDQASHNTDLRSPNRHPASVLRRHLRNVPWSLFIGTAGFGVVWLTVDLVEPDRLLQVMILVATALCALLLMAAQVIDRRRR